VKIVDSGYFQMKKGSKTYSTPARLLVYDLINLNVSTENIPSALASFALRTGHKIIDIPSRSTVEQMARELGVISAIQASECALNSSNITLGFDATTQEGVHVNSISQQITKP
jgi:hypothetical protein